MFNLTVSIETLVYKKMWFWDYFVTNPRVWWGLFDILWALARIIFNKSNKTLWYVTLSVVWFNTIRDFDWTLTQLIWLEIIYLNWEAKKMIKACHTRARAAAAVGWARPCARAWARPRRGRQAASERAGVASVLPLNPHNNGSYSPW